ncbi:hypothetical protein B5F40_04725 [Gordonibacter sp. An230]|nr:hypothetical protein B5F40_04725 [Gordonibacter sp. An230]
MHRLARGVAGGGTVPVEAQAVAGIVAAAAHTRSYGAAFAASNDLRGPFGSPRSLKAADSGLAGRRERGRFSR